MNRTRLQLVSSFIAALMLLACSAKTSDGSDGGSTGDGGSIGNGDAGTCSYNGATYKAGETFMFACNRCSCDSDGSVSCTEIDCE